MKKNRNDNKKRLKGGEKYGDKGKTSKMENWVVKIVNGNQTMFKIKSEIDSGKKIEKIKMWVLNS